jgi:ABC-type lipoprotein export system ATPase subunit
MEIKLLEETRTIEEIVALYPVTWDFFQNYNLKDLSQNCTLAEALELVEEESLAEFGLSRADVIYQFTQFVKVMLESAAGPKQVHSITLLGGRDKLGCPEEIELTLYPGQIISLVGPTGSGKSRLLSDIECLAQKDTPSKRQILVNGKALSDEQRFVLDGKLVAQLSQNMNFVMDLSVREFLVMHAGSRLGDHPEQLISECLACANNLAGEKFTPETKVTQLSGGQSRALMIADTAYLSASPIVLIDEIENAGIDRRKAVSILVNKEKIVLISTHDPLLALSADKRIVIKNGGMQKIIESSPEEQASLALIEEWDDSLQSIRQQLRLGQTVILEMSERLQEKRLCGNFTI